MPQGYTIGQNGMPIYNGNSMADWMAYSNAYNAWYAPIKQSQNAAATWQTPQSFGPNYFGDGADNSNLSGILQNFTTQGYSPTIINPSQMGITDPKMASAFNILQYLNEKANYQNDQSMRLSAQALKGQGVAAKQDIEQNRMRGLSDINQQMANMGLANTTVGNTLGNRVNTLATQESARVDEGVGKQFSDLMQNRQYQGPTTQLYSQLLMGR